MNISGAQRHTKNVEKLLACVPSEQNRPPSHVEAEGVRKHYGRGIKASSLAAQWQAFRNESHPDKTEKCESEREGVCWESHPARRSNETNTRIRGERKISNRMKEKEWGNWEWMLDVYRKKLAEWNMYVDTRAPGRSRFLINALVHQYEHNVRWVTLFSSHCFRPCWRHKGSCAPMCPTSRSIWASQGNSFMLVRCSLWLWPLPLLTRAEMRACTKPNDVTLWFTLYQFLHSSPFLSCPSFIFPVHLLRTSL